MSGPIANAAEGMVGTPFRHRGRRPGAGLDCAGLVLCAHWAAGVALNDVGPYCAAPDGTVVLDALEKQMRRVEDQQPGDIIVLRSSRTGANHLGIWTGTHVVHADNARGRVVMHRIDNRVAAKVVGFWRPA